MNSRCIVGLFACAVLATVTFATLTLTAQSTARSTVVHVTGRGATRYDAREDAIRQALQLAVRQLVLAQRVVQNEKLVLDKVASTMNGFVNRFTPTAESVAGGLVTLEADVEVAESRIENFIGAASGATAQLDTNSLGASIQAEQASRRARSEVAAGLLFGFPQQTLIASAPKVALDPTDPNMVRISSTIQFAPAFVRRLKDGMRALGAERESKHDSVAPFYSASIFRACFTDDFQNEAFQYDYLGECWVLKSVDSELFGNKDEPFLGNGQFWFEALVDKRSRIPQPEVPDMTGALKRYAIMQDLANPNLSLALTYKYSVLRMGLLPIAYSIGISTKAVTVMRKVPAASLLQSQAGSSLAIEPILIDSCLCPNDTYERKIFVPWRVFPRDAAPFPLNDSAFEQLLNRGMR